MRVVVRSRTANELTASAMRKLNVPLLAMAEVAKERAAMGALERDYGQG